MPRTTKYIWFVYGHIPATFNDEPSEDVFTTVWRNAFTQSDFPADEANDCFTTQCSADGEESATHIYFATPLTMRQFWYIGEAIATQFSLDFPVEAGDTADEISVNPDVATFLSSLASQGLYVTIQRNDLGQNQVDVPSYLSNYSLQIIS